LTSRGAYILPVVAIALSCASGQGSLEIPHDASWSTRIAESFVLRHPGAVTYDEGSPDRKWNYEQGLMLVALYRMYLHSGNEDYFDFIRNNLDHYVTESGNISTYKRTDYNLDNIGPGRALLEVYRATGEKKFRAAADTLRQQLREQPRTQEGGFWHKKIYPNQMWLDGLFMAEPFYAMYAKLFNEKDAFDDIADQFIWIAYHTRDPRTGLHYHGWDESKLQQWADSTTGCSPNFWGRAMGWYAMGLVDVLDYFPDDHPKRQQLVAILQNLMESLLRFQDKKTGLWYQVIDQGERQGNYLEGSASCMFAYSMAKGVTKGYLDGPFIEIARRAFEGVLQHLVAVDSAGCVDLHQICRSAGLGGNPYRDGSYEYYVGEPRRTNDMKGYGPFLLAAIELEQAATSHKSR
jgi:unsaturated rhamnogalacturonyl hydrolase